MCEDCTHLSSKEVMEREKKNISFLKASEYLAALIHDAFVISKS